MLRHACLFSVALTLWALVAPTTASAQFQERSATTGPGSGASASPAADGRGVLRVRANVAGATVRIDGNEAGRVPYEGRLEPGRHRIQVEAEGRKRWRGDVQIAAGRTTRAEVELEREVPRGGAWGMLTMTALSAGAGVTLWYFADQLETDLAADRDAGILATNDPRIRKGQWMTIGADVAFGTAFLFGVLAVVYFVRDPYGDSSADVQQGGGAVSLTPFLDPLGRRGGAELRWSF